MKDNFVILARHHTSGDLIALSQTTGDWYALPEDEWPSDGEVPLDLRHSMPVRGSYYQNESQRYCAYWSSDGDFCFRDSNDQTWPLFHRDDEGRVSPRSAVETSIAPARDATGFERAGFLTFALTIDGIRRCAIDYDARLFRNLHQSDTTPFSDRTLGSWDFFVGVHEAVDALNAAAKKMSAPSEACRDTQGSFTSEPPITLLTGQSCTRAGRWGRLDDLHENHLLFEGETMPRSCGHEVQWVWLARE
jgi:hypothetical protein